MPDFEPRPLHLHTLESLCADLVSGRAIIIDDSKLFALANDHTRSALEWYRKKGSASWAAPVSAQNGEELVTAIFKAPPTVTALPARSNSGANRRLTLKKIEAHRFAGLHKFGTAAAAPANYVQEFSSPITLFEGENGSGKTSLINAIIWVLTGEVLRPQREPEKANQEFECWVTAPGGQTEPTAHKLSPVTPLPDLDAFRPSQAWIPADTWVELTFVDEDGVQLTPVRRIQTRTATGKLVETAPDFSALSVDPIALRIGTIMPGMLSLIKVGSESDLGKAVAQLTGLSSLIDLADHVRRAKQKIDKDFTRTKTAEIENADTSYYRAKADLSGEIEQNPTLKPPKPVPVPSHDHSIEDILTEITTHFEKSKAVALASAKTILGDGFDPTAEKPRADLEGNISLALAEVKNIARLPSGVRLSILKQLTADELGNADALLTGVLREGAELELLARKPSTAARARLYARVATWIVDHPDGDRNPDQCVVCGGTLIDVVDPKTGKSVKQHIDEAHANAALLAQTLSRWASSALGSLTRDLPVALRAELSLDLPSHPLDLTRSAFVEELFSTAPFAGVLSSLKTATADAFDLAASKRAELADEREIALPAGCELLATALKRLDRAIRFARWRHANEDFDKRLFAQVLGRISKEDGTSVANSLTAKLLDLDATVKGAAPITRALTACNRLKGDLAKRRAAEMRLREYATASAALANLLQLGDLADRQVDELRRNLRAEASKWRNLIYLAAFPDAAHELVDAGMSRKGELDLIVGAGGISAPAQHVANASALRASLVGFYLAFWEHVLKNRGGLRLLLLDDPQELFDGGNRERLADTLTDVLNAEAQIILTTYDAKFAKNVVRLRGAPGHIEHRSVHPATSNQPLIRTPLSEGEVFKKRKSFEADKNAEEPARAYVESCRVYLEIVLSDLFDDPASSAWIRATPSPSLADYVNRLRGLVSNSPQGQFSASAFKEFVNHPGLASTAATTKLLNKAHHGERDTITPAEVLKSSDELLDLVKRADKLYEECRRWRKRERDPSPTSTVVPIPAIAPVAAPTMTIWMCPDLAAFTDHMPTGESQEAPEQLDPSLFVGKALYGLRRDNFGFAAPKGAVAIVEAEPMPVADRRLVIARHGDAIYARRFLRSEDSITIGLTAETPDPRNAPKTIFLPEAEVALHQVVGVMFVPDAPVGLGQHEAVLIDNPVLLARIEIAYRVKEESAVPLALPKQVVLGGSRIELSELGQYEGALVALSLDDGGSIFKRVGERLAGDLSHLRQFESIGGLGSSQILAVTKEQFGMPRVVGARRIVGVLYRD